MALKKKDKRQKKKKRKEKKKKKAGRCPRGTSFLDPPAPPRARVAEKEKGVLTEQIHHLDSERDTPPPKQQGNPSHYPKMGTSEPMDWRFPPSVLIPQQPPGWGFAVTRAAPRWLKGPLVGRCGPWGERFETPRRRWGRGAIAKQGVSLSWARMPRAPRWGRLTRKVAHWPVKHKRCLPMK